MDIIFIGVYNQNQEKELENLISNFNTLELIWHFEKYKIESEKGILYLKDKFELYSVAVLIRKNDLKPFTSYPLIYEITSFLIGETQTEPIMFDFFNSLKELKTEKMVLAFGDEWNKETLIRLEDINVGDLKKKLNNVHVWREHYFDLYSNLEVKGNHPLVLNISFA